MAASLLTGVLLVLIDAGSESHLLEVFVKLLLCALTVHDVLSQRHI